MIKIVVSPRDRFAVSSFLPQKGSALTMLVRRDIAAKLEFSPKEVETMRKACGVTEATTEVVQLPWAKIDKVVKPLEVELTEGELGLMKSEADRLDSQKEITPEMLGLYRIIVDASATADTQQPGKKAKK